MNDTRAMPADRAADRETGPALDPIQLALVQARLEHIARQIGIDPDAAFRDGANRVRDRMQARRLQDIAARASIGGAR